MGLLGAIFAAHEYAERNGQTVPSALMSAIVAARVQCVLSTPEQRACAAELTQYEPASDDDDVSLWRE
jgi:hypothetical protein